jgi:hypothetical protein
VAIHLEAAFGDDPEVLPEDLQVVADDGEIGVAPGRRAITGNHRMAPSKEDKTYALHDENGR